MTTAYPGALDAFTNPSSAGGDQLDSASVLHDAQHANVNDAVEAIEAELGTAPKGVHATVKARLATAYAAGAMVPTGTTNWFGPWSMTGTVVDTLGPFDDASAARQLVLFEIPRPISFDQVAFQVTTGAAVNCKVLLYALDDNGLALGSKVFESAGASCAATGNVIITPGAPVALVAGKYAADLKTDTASSAVRFRGYLQEFGSSVASSFNQLQTNGLAVPRYTTGTYASPASTPSVTFGNQPDGAVPIIGFRRSA